MAARAVSNRTTISKKILQSLGWINSVRHTAGGASGVVVANRPMTTDTGAVTSDEKSINADRHPATSPAPSRHGSHDEFVPTFFSDPWNPFNPGKTLSQVLNYMDQLMDASLGGRGVLRTGWDAREDDKSLHLKVEMPGLNKDDVKVWLEDNTLVMKGEKEEDEEEDEEETNNSKENTREAKGNQGQWQEQWRARWRYSTRIEIPERGYKLDQIKAGMNHGMLRVVIPKAQEKERGDVIEVKIEG